MELAGDLGPLNVPVWRNHVRKVAGDKKSGETLSFGCSTRIRSSLRVHRGRGRHLHQEQRWHVARPVRCRPPAGFVTPDLNRIIDAKVSDGEVMNMLSSTKGA
jgi:hypothetical protein